MFFYDVVLVQCKKITKFRGVPNIQGAHAVFRLGKPSFKKENLYNRVMSLNIHITETVFRSLSTFYYPFRH